MTSQPFHSVSFILLNIYITVIMVQRYTTREMLEHLGVSLSRYVADKTTKRPACTHVGDHTCVHESRAATMATRPRDKFHT